MSESNSHPKVPNRVVLPPRKRNTEAPAPTSTKPTAPPTQAEVGSKNAAQVARAAPSVRPMQSSAPQKKGAYPPPGISSLAGVPQPGLELQDESDNDIDREQTEEFLGSQVPIKLLPPREDTVSIEKALREIAPFTGGVNLSIGYLALVASLIALGIQVWILLSTRSPW